MAWEIHKRSSTAHGCSGIKFTNIAGKKYAATQIRFCVAALALMKCSRGEFVEIHFDYEKKLIGFKKGTKQTGFGLSGKHASLTISMSTPKNRNARLLLGLFGREVEYTQSNGMLVVNASTEAVAS
jgi:hypothetical protein